MENTNTPKNNNEFIYAPIYQRVLARLIDFIFLGIVTIFLGIIYIGIYVYFQDSSKLQFISETCLKLGKDELLASNYCNGFISNFKTWFNPFLTFLYLIFSFYPIIMTTSRFQASFGKMVFGLKVFSNPKLSKINFLQATTREVFWIVLNILIVIVIWIPETTKSIEQIVYLSQLILIYSIIQAFFSVKKLAWHDNLSETIVLKKFKNKL